MKTSNLASELALLSEKMQRALFAALDAYEKTGVRFALVGGLAAGAYGTSRATRDIDFLVGDEAFVDPHAVLIQFAHPFPLSAYGVAIDAIPLPEDAERHRLLDEALSHAQVDTSTGRPIPVLAPLWLAYMKLAVGRSKDLHDVVQLLDARAVTVEELVALIPAHTPMGTPLQTVIDEWRVR